MAETYRIRPARRGDREGIATLLAEAGSPDSCDSTTLAWVISHPEMEAHLAVDQPDRAIGLVSFSHRPMLRLKGRIATIDELVVAQAWRKKGVGKALLAVAVTRLKVLGCKRLELATQQAGEVAFFEKQGWVATEGRVLRHQATEPKK